MVQPSRMTMTSYLLVNGPLVGRVFSGVDEAFPPPVRIPQDLQRFVDHYLDQVSALLARCPQNGDPIVLRQLPTVRDVAGITLVMLGVAIHTQRNERT